MLPAVSDASDLESQQKWIAGEIQLWLDEEWTKLDVHRELAEATAQVLELHDSVPSPSRRPVNILLSEMPDLIGVICRRMAKRAQRAQMRLDPFF